MFQCSMSSFIRKRPHQMWKHKIGKKKEFELLDGSPVGVIPQPAYVHSKGVHTHTSPHSTVHGGGRGLLENYLWSQQVNSKSRIITHASSPQAHPDYAAAPNHQYLPEDEVNRERRWLCLVSYWKKFPQAGRKKGHLLFTQAMNSAVLVWRATQLVSFNSHMTLAIGYKIKPIFISG